MTEQFICISCWKEFSASSEEIERRGGKVVCPFCGYIQPAPSVQPAGAEEIQLDPASKLENPKKDGRKVAEEIPWSKVADDEDFPVGEEEHTDRVEIPTDIMRLKVKDREISMDELTADEPTPVVEPPEHGMGGFLSRPPREPSNAVLVRAGAATAEQDRAGPPPDWQLKTPSGLVFKFTDPEALLGWKKKLATYKELHVSPDGQRWVDFSRFVREYEELGDPLKAFILSESLSDVELPPPKPLVDIDAPEREVRRPEPQAAPTKKEKKEAEAARTATSPQFTFKVKDEKSTGWGKYLLFAALGLGLGAAIIAIVLYLSS
jgi:DNA-directed RNA polymerase subunit RPC12/RpoP